jgi:hypothetical protein
LIRQAMTIMPSAGGAPYGIAMTSSRWTSVAASPLELLPLELLPLELLPLELLPLELLPLELVPLEPPELELLVSIGPEPPAQAAAKVTPDTTAVLIAMRAARPRRRVSAGGGASCAESRVSQNGHRASLEST